MRRRARNAARARRLAAGLLAGAALTVVLAGPAATASGGPTFSGWDGVDPFHCQLQYAGTGTKVPDPSADPYCVEFDKTDQNVTQLGLVEFLSLEPARTAAAVPKCFYFQSDHWTGSIIQGDGQTELYHFDGHYFFDKARGAGGVWVTNFTIAGHEANPAEIPGVPEQYAQYFGPGTGGAQGSGNVPADPSCAAKAAADPSSVYASPSSAPGVAPGSGGLPSSSSPRASCLVPGGPVTARAIGPGALGQSESRARALLGRPYDVRAGLLHYCLRGGGKFVLAMTGSRAPDTVMILTTSSAYRLHGVGRGSSAGAFHRRFGAARPFLRQGATRVWRSGPGSGVLFGIRDSRIRFLAVYERGVVRTRTQIARLLRRSQ